MVSAVFGSTAGTKIRYENDQKILKSEKHAGCWPGVRVESWRNLRVQFEFNEFWEFWRDYYHGMWCIGPPMEALPLATKAFIPGIP